MKPYPKPRYTHAWEVPASQVAEALPQMQVDDEYMAGIQFQSDEAVSLWVMDALMYARTL